MTAPQGKPGINVIGVAAAVGGALVGALAVQFLMGGGKSDRDKVDEQLASNRVGQIIKREFPQDYDNIVTQLTALATDKSLDDSQRMVRGAQLTANVRAKYASFAGKASDDYLRQVLQSQVTIYRAVKDKLGDASCIDLVNNGPKALLASGQMQSITQQADDAGVTMMNAIVDGHHNPVTYRQPTDADFNAMHDAVLAKGLTEEQFVSAGDGISNPGDCDGNIAVFEAASNLPGEAGSVMRAVLVATIAGS